MPVSIHGMYCSEKTFKVEQKKVLLWGEKGKEENSPHPHENWILLHTASYFAVQVFSILLLLLKGTWYFSLQSCWKDLYV